MIVKRKNKFRSKKSKILILASQSPRRIELLNQLDVKFIIDPSNLEEEQIKKTNRNPVSVVLETAKAKAKAVAYRYRNGIIISADTIVVLGKEILGKPKSKQEAYLMLKKLSGRQHKVITAIAVIDAKTKEEAVGYTSTKVKFRKLSNKEIKKYINTGEPMDKAGAYAIQGKGAAFIESISGDYLNVVGFPLILLNKLLNKFSYSLL